MSSESSFHLPKFEWVGSFPLSSIYFFNIIVSLLCDGGQVLTCSRITAAEHRVWGRKRPRGDKNVTSSSKWQNRFPVRFLPQGAVTGISHSYEFIGTGVTCSTDLSPLSSAFTLFSSLNSRPLIPICSTKSSLLDIYTFLTVVLPLPGHFCLNPTQAVRTAQPRCQACD